MDILIDFDGTCVTHDFPKVGKDIGSIPVLKELTEKGHNLILFTMRSNTSEGTYLDDAVERFKDNEIPLFGIQEHPNQKEWTSSPKAYGQLIIDDIGLGIPLNYNSFISKRNYVCWNSVEKLLKLQDII